MASSEDDDFHDDLDFDDPKFQPPPPPLSQEAQDRLREQFGIECATRAVRQPLAYNLGSKGIAKPVFITVPRLRCLENSDAFEAHSDA